MMYALYQYQSDLLELQRGATGLLSRLMAMAGGLKDSPLLRPVGAGCELFTRLRVSHTQPPFGIERVSVHGREVPVTEVQALATPFASLLHFRKDGEPLADRPMPKVLVVAPMSTTSTSPTGTMRATCAAPPVPSGSRITWTT
jgi:poly(3-hydroxybutyrate) depolymerase